MIKIRKGLDIPITGEPEPIIKDASVNRVALTGLDYHGMRPTMLVAEGDVVQSGQPLFEDKKTDGLRFTSPGTGRIVEINRGLKRAFLSIVVELDGDEGVTFASYDDQAIKALECETVQKKLLDSGLWTAFRTRPFSQVPVPGSEPAAIFVPSMASGPGGLDPAVVLGDQSEAFSIGLEIISKLTKGDVFVTKRMGTDFPVLDSPRVKVCTFDGPHPAGLVGTHIHFLSPVGVQRTVWHVDPQDVLAIATLFRTGKLDHTRVVALSGPQVEKPCYLRTRLGANTDELTNGQLREGENRVISGSVLSGRRAFDQIAYLGRYHTQISALLEGRDHEFLGWLGAGGNKHSLLNLFISKLAFGKKFEMSTSLNGSPRAMVPVGSYEAVMPLDILPTQLLRALIVGDTDSAQELGCLELDEEDLALCTYVCPGKYDYGPILRKNLTQILKEG